MKDEAGEGRSRPTLSQVEAWRPEALSELGEELGAAAREVETCVAVLQRVEGKPSTRATRAAAGEAATTIESRRQRLIDTADAVRAGMAGSSAGHAAAENAWTVVEYIDGLHRRLMAASVPDLFRRNRID